MQTGAQRIAAERQRQVDSEGWTSEHDDEHGDGSLALAAVCYAAPRHLFIRTDLATGVHFSDPWPEAWGARRDKRGSYGNSFNGIADPNTYTPKQRIDLLTKAGALIAAEIDRLLRLDQST